MPRNFSTSAKALLSFLWKGTTSVKKYEEMIENAVSKNSKLKNADQVQINGQEHISAADNKLRVSGPIFEAGKKLTSVHAYADGTVKYSKDDYNQAQGK